MNPDRNVQLKVASLCELRSTTSPVRRLLIVPAYVHRVTRIIYLHRIYSNYSKYLNFYTTYSKLFLDIESKAIRTVKCRQMIVTTCSQVTQVFNFGQKFPGSNL